MVVKANSPSPGRSAILALGGPWGGTTEKLTTTIKAGVLELHAPKLEVAKPKKHLRWALRRPQPLGL